LCHTSTPGGPEGPFTISPQPDTQFGKLGLQKPERRFLARRHDELKKKLKKEAFSVVDFVRARRLQDEDVSRVAFADRVALGRSVKE
jgi:hypothetical protein